MKILLFAEWFANLGGSETLNKNLFLELKSQGIDILLVTSEKKSRIHKKWQDELALHKDSIRFLNEKCATAELLTVIKRFSPDLIHFSPYEKTAWEYLQADEQPDIPILATESSDGSDLCYWDFYKDKLPGIINNFKVVHCVSLRAAKNLRQHYNFKNETVVIPPPFEQGYYPNWKSKEKKNRALFAGRLSQEKGIIFLLTIWNDIIDLFGDIKLDVWGTGPQRDEAAALIEKLNLGGHVELKGEYQEFSSIPVGYYDFMIIPSHFEGLPYVFMEGMYCGIPTIVTKISGAEDLSSKPMLFQTIYPEDKQDILKAIDRIYKYFSDMHLYCEERRWTIVSKCSTKIVAQNFIHTYQQIIKAANCSTVSSKDTFKNS